MIVMKVWLGDIIPDPTDKRKTIPRMMSYLEEKGENVMMQIVDDEKYIPTGAVKEIGKKDLSNIKYCPECGTKNSTLAKFCVECGEVQQ